MVEVLCIGNASWDISVFVAAFPRENSKGETDQLLEAGGGLAANAAYLLSRGLLEEPLYLQFVMGILGGIQATFYDLVHLKQTADRLFGEGKYRWSAFGAGQAEYPTCTAAALLGGNCRVGMEDALYISRGVLAESNAALVEKMVRILSEFSLEPATPAEAREILAINRAKP